MLSPLDILFLLELTKDLPKYGEYRDTLCLNHIYVPYYRWKRGVYKNIPIGASNGYVYFVEFYGRDDYEDDGDTFEGTWKSSIVIIRFDAIGDVKIKTQLSELFNGDLDSESGVCVSDIEELNTKIREEELKVVVASFCDGKLNPW